MLCSIPANFKICTKCDDSMDTHVRPIYRFFFEIEDEEGDRLIVSAVNPKVHPTPPISVWLRLTVSSWIS